MVLVSDCPDPISPCALCREYLISVGTRNTQIVMGNGNGDIITQCSLGELFPFPSVYRFQSRDSLVKGGLMFSSKMKKVSQRIYIPALRLIYPFTLVCVNPVPRTYRLLNLNPVLCVYLRSRAMSIPISFDCINSPSVVSSSKVW